MPKASSKPKDSPDLPAMKQPTLRDNLTNMANKAKAALKDASGSKPKPNAQAAVYDPIMPQSASAKPSAKTSANKNEASAKSAFDALMPKTVKPSTKGASSSASKKHTSKGAPSSATKKDVSAKSAFDLLMPKAVKPSTKGASSSTSKKDTSKGASSSASKKDTSENASTSATKNEASAKNAFDSLISQTAKPSTKGASNSKTKKDESAQTLKSTQKRARDPDIPQGHTSAIAAADHQDVTMLDAPVSASTVSSPVIPKPKPNAQAGPPVKNSAFDVLMPKKSEATPSSSTSKKNASTNGASGSSAGKSDASHPGARVENGAYDVLMRAPTPSTSAGKNTSAKNALAKSASAPSTSNKNASAETLEATPKRARDTDVPEERPSKKKKSSAAPAEDDQDIIMVDAPVSSATPVITVSYPFIPDPTIPSPPPEFVTYFEENSQFLSPEGWESLYKMIDGKFQTFVDIKNATSTERHEIYARLMVKNGTSDSSSIKHVYDRETGMREKSWRLLASTLPGWNSKKLLWMVDEARKRNPKADILWISYAGQGNVDERDLDAVWPSRRPCQIDYVRQNQVALHEEGRLGASGMAEDPPEEDDEQEQAGQEQAGQEQEQEEQEQARQAEFVAKGDTKILASSSVWGRAGTWRNNGVDATDHGGFYTRQYRLWNIDGMSTLQRDMLELAHIWAVRDISFNTLAVGRAKYTPVAQHLRGVLSGAAFADLRILELKDAVSIHEDDSGAFSAATERCILAQLGLLAPMPSMDVHRTRASNATGNLTTDESAALTAALEGDFEAFICIGKLANDAVSEIYPSSPKWRSTKAAPRGTITSMRGKFFMTLWHLAVIYKMQDERVTELQVLLYSLGVTWMAYSLRPQAGDPALRALLPSQISACLHELVSTFTARLNHSPAKMAAAAAKTRAQPLWEIYSLDPKDKNHGVPLTVFEGLNFSRSFDGDLAKFYCVTHCKRRNLHGVERPDAYYCISEAATHLELRTFDDPYQVIDSQNVEAIRGQWVLQGIFRIAEQQGLISAVSLPPPEGVVDLTEESPLGFKNYHVRRPKNLNPNVYLSNVNDLVKLTATACGLGVPAIRSRSENRFSFTIPATHLDQIPADDVLRMKYCWSRLDGLYFFTESQKRLVVSNGKNKGSQAWCSKRCKTSASINDLIAVCKEAGLCAEAERAEAAREAAKAEARAAVGTTSKAG
ncbi:hypothetical protein K438DRAFT_1995514 [Mycena galopus ATCC 62051]|nr:hypothetical protein K438DRAFT_1995514 [Mycena galopus ATCC 62051]